MTTLISLSPYVIQCRLEDLSKKKVWFCLGLKYGEAMLSDPNQQCNALQEASTLEDTMVMNFYLILN